jgi:uncharacterized protein (TIGR02270 family)
MKRARTILWEIYEQHFDEAAFLFGQFEDALVAANYTLDEVAEGPEERLAAHLDGLVLGGKPVADRLLLPALDGDEPAPAFVAAWSLLHAEDVDHLDTVLSVLADGTPPVRDAVARAFELAERVDVASKVAPLWESDDPFVKRVVLDVLAWRHPTKASEHLRAAFDSRDAGLVAAALRLLRAAPDTAYTNDVAAAVDHAEPAVRVEALATAHALHVAVRAAAFRDVAASGADPSWTAMALLGLRDEAAVQALVDEPEARRAAVWALGFAGTRTAGDRLVTLLEDEATGAIAAEALSAMSGLVVSGSLARPAERQGVEVEEEVGLDDPPPEVRREDALPLARAPLVAHWWQTARSSIPERTPYLGGRPRGRDTLRAALAGGPMWRRGPIALELAALERGPVSIDVRAWTKRQKILSA